MTYTPNKHKIVPIPVLIVNSSFRTMVEAKIIARNDKVTATGYAVLRSIFDKTYSHVRNPVMYKRTPKTS
jgi:hypothetical protein